MNGRKLKGPKFFQNPSITVNKNEKKIIEGGRKLEGPKIKGSKIWKNFFTARSVERWNSLPHSVQNVGALNEFKAEYDKFYT